MVPVKVGDVLEFAPLVASAGGGEGPLHAPPPKPLVTAKVVDVDALGDSIECVVQISPYEPLQRLRLQDVYYKVVYEAGEMTRSTPEMAGWEIELFTATKTEDPDAAVIKRVDTDLNCALVAFANGQKEWMDLSLAKFKVIGRPSTDPPATSPSRRAAALDRAAENQIVVEGDTAICSSSDTTIQKNAPADTQLVPPIQMLIPRLSVPLRVPTVEGRQSERRMSTAFVPIDVPSVDTEVFDWYTEGGHVELCDGDGAFHEGAVLCSRTQTHIQLFNERRQFFEVSIAIQPFKVVIHGLLSLKTIPLGQAVDVYSPMSGGFRSGTVIKTAELGRLTPISFAPEKTVEWLDLSTQTFKLVFVPPETFSPDKPASGIKSTSSHRSPQYPHARRAVQWPILQIGQRVELLDEDSKQYVKYSVAKILDEGSHEYIFEPLVSSPSKISLVTGSQSEHWRPIVGTLMQLRCRLPLQISHWQEYRKLLVGQRLDVYDKVSKSVANGRVMEVSSADGEPSLLVRFKDGSKEWVFLRSSKVKLRLHGHDGEPKEVSSAALLLEDQASHSPDLSQSGVGNGSHPSLTSTDHGVGTGQDFFDAADSVAVNSEPTPTRYRPKFNRRLSNCPITDIPVHEQIKFAAENCVNGIPDDKVIEGQNSLSELDPTSAIHQSKLDPRLSHSPSTDLPAHQQAGFAVQGGVVSDATNTDNFGNHGPLGELEATPTRCRPKFNRRLSDCRSSDLEPQQQQPSIGSNSSSEAITQPISRVQDAAAMLPTGQPINVEQSSGLNNTTEGSTFKSGSIQVPPDLDLWTEEMGLTLGSIQYVHVVTGAKQQSRPMWIQRLDAASGKCFAIHTPTNTTIELPTNTRGQLSLPVGPIEAVRAQETLDQLPTNR